MVRGDVLERAIIPLIDGSDGAAPPQGGQRASSARRMRIGATSASGSKWPRATSWRRHRCSIGTLRRAANTRVPSARPPVRDTPARPAWGRAVRVPFDEARAVAADEFVPLDGRRARGRRRSLNSMARETLLAGGKDFPHEPGRAPVLQRARQLGHGHGRHHVGLKVAALVEEGADRRDVGIGSKWPRATSWRRHRRCSIGTLRNWFRNASGVSSRIS
jgi:hypothetical protein